MGSKFRVEDHGFKVEGQVGFISCESPLVPYPLSTSSVAALLLVYTPERK